MSKSNSLETDFLNLIFNAVGIANVADNAGTAPLTELFLALHTADPGEAGNQSTNEATYTSYARVGVARTAGGWTVAGDSVTLTSDVEFPAATGGTNTITHFSVGVAVSGVTDILFSGNIAPSPAVTTGVIPRLTTATVITED